MEATTTQQQRTREEVVAWLHRARERHQAWQEQTRREWKEMQVEVERAKANPFYQIGSADSHMVCEPAPMPAPQFKPGSFVAAIRRQRASQREWQELVNRKLDGREAEYQASKEHLKLAVEEV